MTIATDHKNNLNRSVLKKDYARTLRVETIANSAGGTAQVSIVSQPSRGFLNTKYYSNGFPTEDTEDCLGRNHCSTHPVKILDPFGVPLRYDWAYGHGLSGCDYSIRGLRRGETTWAGPTSMPTLNRRILHRSVDGH